MDKYIKTYINWCLPYTDKKIKTEYILKVPNGITLSFYNWVASCSKIPYKTKCFLDRLKSSTK